MGSLSFEKHVALLIDREVNTRHDRKLVRLLKNVHLKYGQAAIEDNDARMGRAIKRREVMSLILADWVTADSLRVELPKSSKKKKTTDPS